MKSRRRKMRRRLSTPVPMLKMTALMDIFSTLLLFLLKSYVADGQAGTVTAGITLPSSIAQSEPYEAPTIAVNKQFIALEGERMVESTVATSGPNLKIEQLYTALVEMRVRLEDTPEFRPRISIQGDRSIEFRLLQRVMYSCQLAGFTQVSLNVLQDDKMLEMTESQDTDS